jgi:HEAT repeat protein
MRRNACIVLGNRRDGASAPALRRALADADPVVRDSAAWALARIEENPEGCGSKTPTTM